MAGAASLLCGARNLSCCVPQPASPASGPLNWSELSGQVSKLHCSHSTRPQAFGLKQKICKLDAQTSPSWKTPEAFVISSGGRQSACSGLLRGASASCGGYLERPEAGTSSFVRFETPWLKPTHTALASSVGRKARRGRIKASASIDATESNDGHQGVPEALGSSASSEGKACSECRVHKPLRNFEKSPTSPDGRHLLCRACLAVHRAKRRNEELHHLALSVAEAWAQAKTCRHCKQVQELREFYRRPKIKSGVGSQCRSCISEVREQRIFLAPVAVEVATCSRCRQEKPASKFGSSKHTRHGLQSCCKDCHVETSRECRERVRAFGAYLSRPDKVCGACGVRKSAESFGNKYYLPDGLSSHCRECTSRKHVEYMRARKRSSKDL